MKSEIKSTNDGEHFETIVDEILWLSDPSRLSAGFDTETRLPAVASVFGVVCDVRDGGMLMPDCGLLAAVSLEKGGDIGESTGAILGKAVGIPNSWNHSSNAEVIVIVGDLFFPRGLLLIFEAICCLCLIMIALAISVALRGSSVELGGPG